jgi:Xaa-Pro aminopeptidase
MADPFTNSGEKPEGVGVGPIPFDQARLDQAMDNAGVDALLVTNHLNIRYLTGGYHCIFYDAMDQLGVSKYGPTILYRKAQPERSFFLGSYFDKEQLPNDPIWVPNAEVGNWVGTTTPPLIADWVKKEKLEKATIGIESPFLSVEVYLELQKLLPDVTWVNAVTVLEYLRAIKTPKELDTLRIASEKIVETMKYGFRQLRPGMSSRDIEQVVAARERELGMGFDYCLVGFGKDTNRTPRANITYEAGTIAGFDSGGNIDGYIGDLCRMGSQGEPEPLQKQVLDELDHVQMAARKPMKPGARGGSIREAAMEAIKECEHGSSMGFIVHGMGLVSHEAPRLVTKPIPYSDEWAERPLEEGLVVSIETTFARPDCGYIKLEDTVAVTATGFEGFGDGGRGWNPIGD